MDERERAFAASGEWFVLAHGSDALLFVTRMSENLRRGITLSLVYRDDAHRPNPPEDSPGTVPLVGYGGRGIEQPPRRRHEFAPRLYTPPPHPPRRRQPPPPRPRPPPPRGGPAGSPPRAP